VLVFALLIDRAASIAGALTGAIVVGGFLAHALPALRGASEEKLRRVTAIGGIAGLCVILVVVVLSAFLGSGS
jgi:cytochrome bd-type quinol oxidase subunit 1